MKNVILSVSFGTTDAEARETCIASVEQAYAQAYPNYDVRRAFTSGFICRKLAKSGIMIDTAQDAINELKAQGRDFVIASTHMIPGQEYEKLLSIAGDVKVSEPLLTSEADLERVAAFLENVHQEEGRTLIVMGHGTEHAANETYQKLREKLADGIFVACVEGSYTLETVLDEIRDRGTRKVALMPLMLVAGDHARNDMAGDEPDSWKSILEEKGYDVKARLKGLGEEPEIRRMFVEKLGKVINK